MRQTILVSNRGQITLPASVRKRLGIQSGGIGCPNTVSGLDMRHWTHFHRWARLRRSLLILPNPLSNPGFRCRLASTLLKTTLTAV